MSNPMTDPQARVQSLLDRLVQDGTERGVQVAVYHDGELVVDAWAGVADAATGRAVDGDTLFTVWSAGKPIAAMVLHLLVERGALRYDTPLASFWSEFGAHGKERITVEHVLTHTAGIPQVPDVTPEELLDWDTMCQRVAALAPLWTPGEAMGYHAMTYGWLVGETARRIDGRPFAQIVREDIAALLGLDDLYFGIPDSVEHRVATLEETPSPPTPPVEGMLVVNTTPPWRNPSSAWANQSAVRRAGLPSSGAISNARTLARFYADLVSDSPTLVPRSRVLEATTLRRDDFDVILGVRDRRALGFHLGGPLSPMSERMSAFGHAGAGGTFAFGDPRHRLAFALVKNHMRDYLPGEDSAYLVAREVRAALGIPERE
jgi:CubicO group peptidase (beta-lactamase class C family)